MRVSNTNWFYVLIMSLMCFTCKAPVEVYQGETDAYFKERKSFNFMEVNIDNQTDLEPYQPNLDLLKASITKELEARGYTQSTNPDLLVNIGIVITEEEATRETNIREAPIYTGQRNYKWQSEEVVYDVYKKGSMVIDLIDSQTKELVWKGAGSRVIPKNVEKRAKIIRENVEVVFKKFPVQPS